VGRQDDRATARGKRIPMPRRDRQASLCVEIELACSLKHRAPTWRAQWSGCPIVSHQTTLFATLVEKFGVVKARLVIFLTVTMT
jgi:hypothetical protein